MLILDEPTSGVDPLARDQFWELLIDLSRNQNVTIFVSTHFMNEAARCDRISLMNDGRVLATDTPAALIKARGAATLEEAFISYLEEATAPAGAAAGERASTPSSRIGTSSTAVGRRHDRVAVQPSPDACLQHARNARAPARSDPARRSLCSAPHS